MVNPFSDPNRPEDVLKADAHGDGTGGDVAARAPTGVANHRTSRQRISHRGHLLRFRHKGAVKSISE